MSIDEHRIEEKTAEHGSADQAGTIEQQGHESTTSASRVGKLLAWPDSESLQSDIRPKETDKPEARSKREKARAERVRALSPCRPVRRGRRLLRTSLGIAILVAVVSVALIVFPSLTGHRVKGAWSRLLALAITDKSATSIGRVVGIMYSDDKASALIDGSLAHEGDVLYGVTIVKINSSSVEFKKDEHTWTQRLNEAPSEHWPSPHQAPDTE